MFWVVSPVDQRYLLAAGAERITLPPLQKVVGLCGLMLGVWGKGFTETVTGCEAAEVQPAALMVLRLKVPAVSVVMVWVLAPLLQR